MKKKNIKILICTHKEAELPRHEYFFPIQAGSAIAQKRLPYQQDDIGDNISAKNRNYCELTAHYWAWKNLKDVDIIGLNHYRRYFDFYRKFKCISPDRSFADTKQFIKAGYKFPDIEHILDKYDIIMAKKRNVPYNLATQYCVYHIVEDLNTLRDTIGELTPDYLPAFETLMHDNKMSFYNMFITKWKHFDGYSEWLFKILSEMEKRIKISPYPGQARIFGYFSERLINVYCIRHNLKIYHCPVIMPLDDYKKDFNPSDLHYTLRMLKYKLSYKLQ